MYPLIRILLEAGLSSRKPPLPLGGTHVSHHRCMPWDLDTFLELNNGRTLTLLDIGRTGLAMRSGLLSTLRAQRWGLTVAGISVRYRKRIRALDRFDIHSQAIGRDARFIYLHQSIWKPGGEAACSALYRVGVTAKGKLVPVEDVAKALGEPDWNPPLPPWAEAWIEAEAHRPWPPDHTLPTKGLAPAPSPR